MNTKWLLLDYLLVFALALVLGLFIGRVSMEPSEEELPKDIEPISMNLRMFGVSFKLPPPVKPQLVLMSDRYIAEELEVNILDVDDIEMPLEELFKAQRLIPLDNCSAAVKNAARGGTPDGQHLMLLSDGVHVLSMKGRRMYVDDFMRKVCVKE